MRRRVRYSLLSTAAVVALGPTVPMPGVGEQTPPPGAGDDEIEHPETPGEYAVAGSVGEDVRDDGGAQGTDGADDDSDADGDDDTADTSDPGVDDPDGDADEGDIHDGDADDPDDGAADDGDADDTNDPDGSDPAEDPGGAERDGDGGDAHDTDGHPPAAAEPEVLDVAPADATEGANRSGAPVEPAPEVGTDVTGDDERRDPTGGAHGDQLGDGADTGADTGASGGLRAEVYDGVYAQGVPIWVAMSATRQLESGDNYRAQARGSTASGAYQVIDSTWNRYGGYARAVDAPPAVQDQFAYESMTAILKAHGNDVAAIPVVWYYPAALRNPSLMDVVPAPNAGNVLTPRQYQGRWMAAFHRHLEAGSPVFLPSDSDPLIPAIAFPVLGPTRFHDDWHAHRDGGARRHEGLDLIGENGQPLRAAFDGVVTRIRPDDVGRAGVGITITRADGVRANYFHLDAELGWHPDLEVGDTVKAGQVIGFMGSTGNAGIPHLHFELRTSDGEPIAPYPAVLDAIQREQCSVGIGPWSTEFSSPATIAELLAERLAAQVAAAEAGLDRAPDGGTGTGDSADPDVDEPVVHEIAGPDGARWTVTDGRAVTATGVGALIAPGQGGCDNVPDDEFGTGAGGLGIDLLPEEWWGDEVDADDLAAMIEAVSKERSAEFDLLAIDLDVASVRLMIAGRGVLSASVLLTKHHVASIRDVPMSDVPVAAAADTLAE